MEVFKEVERSILKSHSEAEALELLSQLEDIREKDGEWTLLHYACYNGWYEVAKILIEKYNCDPNCRNGDGSIPLYSACSSGNLCLVKYLVLDKGCDPNDKNSKGQAPLHSAALGGHLNVIKFLIEECKVASTIKDYKGQTSVHYACKQGSLHVIEYLIEEQSCNPACPNKNGQTPLHSACLMGRLHVAKYLIEKKNCDPVCKKNSGRTPLHYACDRGHLSIAKYLIEEQNVDPSIEDTVCWTPLHLACRNGHLHVAKYLIEEQHCDPSCNHNKGWTPLHFACENGYLVIVKYLIEEQQCNPADTRNNGQTPLHSACLMGHLPVAKYLIENHGCNAACRMNGGRTPLHFSCQNGHLNVVEYLIESQHVNPSITDKANQTPLHPACLMGHLHVVKYLIEKQGCDPACRKNDGQTPLHLACEHFNVAKYLIEEQNVNPSIKDNASWTPLHSACQKGNLHVVDYLIEEHLCNPVCKSEDGSTPLTIACQMGHIHVAVCLIETYECDATATANDGQTTLHLACYGGNLSLVKYLINKQHIDPCTKDRDGKTPLQLACLKGYLEVIKYLIEEQQCDPTCSDNNGWTPLHYVCQKGNMEAVKYLVEEHHCNPSCKDKDDKTPLHSACLRGHLQILQYLIDICICDPICGRGWNDDQMLLHFASQRGHLSVVKCLVEEYHIDPSGKNIMGQTPLHSACLNGHLEITEYLLNKCQCDPICKDSSGSTPFSLALNKKDMAITTLMMSIIYKDRYQNGLTYLHLASSRGDYEVVKFLIEDRNFNPQCTDNEGFTPLHLASKHGHITVVQYLIFALKCNPVCKSNDGTVPSSLAIANNHMYTAIFLLRKEYGVHQNNLLIHSACKAGHLINVQYLAKCFNPYVRDSDGFAPLHIACENGYLEIVKFLVQTFKCNPMCITSDAWTPLHSATKCGNLDIVKYLIKEQQCNPNCRTLNGITPLQLACRYQHFDIVVFLMNKCICDVSSSPTYGNSLMEETLKSGNDTILFFLMSHGLQLTLKYGGINHDNNIVGLVQPVLKVFVLGNAVAGKSTLIKALLSKLVEGDWFKRIFNPKVTGVEPHTAGIIPYHAHSPSCGRLILYDFAGQHEHYSSSHAAILEKLRCAQNDLVFIVVDISRPREQLTKELKYWDSFVSNQYGQGKPPVIVIGSHLDVTKLQGKQTLSQALNEVPHLDTCVTLDCTRKSSPGLTEICKHISAYSKLHRDNFNVSAQLHFLNRLIQENFSDKLACQFYEIFDSIQLKDNEILRINQLLPLTIKCLSSELSALSEHGQFLYIENPEDTRQSWIIFKKEVLLSELNGSLFAPKEFESVYKDLSSTGVVALSKVKEAFPHHDHKMLMSFMTNLDFCHEIDKSDISIISNDHDPCDKQLSNPEQHYFFPALVSTDSPIENCQAIIAKTYKFGWCLCCKRNIFFTSRFLQVLLLRLAFTFALPEASSTNKEHSFVVERRKCNIWKNGIHWQNMNGVETIVEVIEQNTAVMLLMGCLEGSQIKCIQQRSAVIQTILSVKEKYSAAVYVKESLIHPDELASYPMGEMQNVFTFPLSTLRTVIKEEAEALTNKISRRQEMINVDKLLYFEPYTCLNGELVQKLIERSDQNKVFDDSDDDFFNECAKVAHPKMDLLKKTLLLPEHNSEYNTAVKEHTDQFSDDPTRKCFYVFKTWQKFTPSSTYKGLREALDSYSIFRRRYPLP